MKLKPWAKMPVGWIQDGKLKQFDWAEGSQGTAALMIYFSMCQFAVERQLRPSEIPEPSSSMAQEAIPSSPVARPMQVLFGSSVPAAVSHSLQDAQHQASTFVKPNPDFVALFGATKAQNADDVESEVGNAGVEWPEYLVARLTYDDLGALTGLSRARISAGLQKLIRVGMIWRVDESSSYGLVGFGSRKRWAKLPGSALLSAGRTEFYPFKHFTLRSKHELNALKLHLYYANARSQENAYCEVSYRVIHERTGVPERDIPRANSFLISCGILQRTRGLPSEDVKQHEANKYHLTGYEGFFITRKAA